MTRSDTNSQDDAAFSWLPQAATWRRSVSARASLLIDGEAYFSALRSVLLAAKREILIAGWTFAPHVRLSRARNGDPADSRVIDVLRRAVSDNPDLRVSVLVWKSHWSVDPKAPFRAALAELTTSNRVRIVRDGALPFLASHHQKIVCVDGRLAFIGGIDLGVGRWDRIDHPVDESRREDAGDGRYGPRHDVQAVISGPSAQTARALFEERWRHATGESLTPAPDWESEEDGEAPWPEGVAVQMRDIPTAVSRTVGAYRGAPAIREIDALYGAFIRRATDFLYIENQYLTSRSVCRALVDKLDDDPTLTVLIIGPREANGVVEKATMRAGRAAVWREITSRGHAERVIVAHPCRQDPSLRLRPIYVHSKLAFADTNAMTVGSANISNRSLTLDTEVMLTFAAVTDAHREAMKSLRARLLAEHTGLGVDVLAQLVPSNIESLIAGGGDRDRVLARLPDSSFRSSKLSATLRRILDPER